MMRYLLAILLICVPRAAQAQWSAVNSGVSLPALCHVGDVFITTAVPTLNVCNVTNTWTPVMVFSAGGAAWGALTGTLSNQSDLQTALNAKQATLVNATNIKTINGSTVLGSGDLTVGGAVAWGGVTGTLANQTDLQTALDAKQPLDSDLTTIAGLTATTNNFLVSVSSAWASRTPAQVKTTLAIANTDVSGLGTLSTQSGTFSGTSSGTNTGDQTITLTGNVTGTGTGSFAATIANSAVTLAKMADMASASLIYRKTGGAGAPEVNTLATLKTDLALVKGDVGLGNVDNTSDANKPVSTAEQTALNLKANLASPTFTGTVALPASTAFTTPVLGVATGTSLAVTGLITSSSATAGIGYVAGSGGAQTQATNKATTVVSNTITTAITMNGAALAAAAIVSFTFTNSTIAALDQVICTHQSAGTNGAYLINARPAAGSASIAVRNTTAGSLSEAIVLRCSVYKAVSS